jgi:uncharacterized protein
MSNRASSSRAERADRPWYREPWPWLLAAGPLAVVVASLASAWIAVKSDDGLVEEDYYKRGLLINRKLEQVPADDTLLRSATVRVAADGEVRVRVEGAKETTEAPPTFRLTLAHPTHSAPNLVVTLQREPGGEYVGLLPEQTPGRWIVTLEADGWRLPATTVAGRLTEIRLGAAPGHS